MDLIKIDYKINTHIKDLSKEKFTSYILAADVGGTTTNIGIAGINEMQFDLIFSLFFKTSKLNSIIPAIKKCLEIAKEKYDIKVKIACIGAAGIINKQEGIVRLTNANWSIHTSEIIQQTDLEEIHLINDFQALGYGINTLNLKKDILCINTKIKDNKETRAVIGAGTGLGKSILIYDKVLNFFKPIPSEGGHSDFPAYNNFEIELTKFIKQYRNISEPIYYEELLSGRGIENIYYFFKIKKHEISENATEIENAEDIAKKIFELKNKDKVCNKIFILFAKLYARCAKNFVLDTMATGGLFIGGGIASKNTDLIKLDDFSSEFTNGFKRDELLKNIPICIITNKNVSLNGAIFAALINQKGKNDE